MVFERPDDILTDNTQIERCKQCKDCVNWGNNKSDFRSNAFDKAYCDEFPHPNRKPRYVIDDTDSCPYRKIKNG